VRAKLANVNSRDENAVGRPEAVTPEAVTPEGTAHDGSAPDGGWPAPVKPWTAVSVARLSGGSCLLSPRSRPELTPATWAAGLASSLRRC